MLVVRDIKTIHYNHANGHWETLTRYLGPKADKKNHKQATGPVNYQVKQVDKYDVMLSVNQYHV